MSRVTIGRTPTEDAAGVYHSIGRFGNILEDYADIFDVNLQAQWPLDMPPASAHAVSITVNFFEQGLAQRNYSARTSAFGHIFRTEVRCLRPIAVLADVGRSRLLGFDGELVAHTLARSIYIDFDFLRTCWDGHDEVLRIILAWGIAQIVTPPIGSKPIAGRFTKYLKERCAEKAEDACGKFVAWQQDLSKKSLQKYEQKLLTCAQESVEREAALVEAIRELEAFEGFYGHQDSHALSTEQLADDFDRLRRLFGVAKVGIREGRIVVATNRLEQIFPRPGIARAGSEESESYDVGSIEFSIDPFFESYGAIYFWTLERGEYRNAHFHDSNDLNIKICFGNQTADGGMNLAIDKLLYKFKVPDVVALVLTFFRFVNSPPQKNNPDVAGKKHESACGTYEYTEGDWECEKQAYVFLMQETMLARERKDRLQELNTRVNNRELAFRWVKNCWAASGELALARRYLEVQFAAIADTAEKNLELLRLHPAVIGFDVEHGLRIWFTQPDVFRYPALLSVQEDGLARLITFFDYFGQADNHAVLWGSSEPMRLIAQGAYAKLLTEVMKITLEYLQMTSSDV